MGEGGRQDKRGLLKPEVRLTWKGSPPAPAAGRSSPAAPQGAPGPRPKRPQGLPSNAIPLSQYTMDELRKMAVSRGIPVEKLVAQLIQQYLKEE